jgi:hypothetical protein
VREKFIAILNGLGEQLDLNNESIENPDEAIISRFLLIIFRHTHF